MAMGADVERAVLAIVTCTKAPKTFGQCGSGATRDRDVEEAHWGRYDWTIITKLHDERTVGVHSILV